MNKNKTILIFGAGKIGRSFIGQLFGQADYEIIFVDVDEQLVNKLNQRKRYPVIIKGEKEETILVRNVRAVSGFDQENVVNEILNASIMAVCVGKNALIKIIPTIALALNIRYKNNPGQALNIIIAENMRSADEFIRNQITKLLPKNYPFDTLVGLVETSIGKMVPLMTVADQLQDPLVVFAEPYNELILDKKGFKGEIPKVNGLAPKENIKAWVDRKAFIHNLGHATAAYAGAFYHPNFQFIYEILGDKKIFSFTKKVMQQAAAILLNYYPNDFTFKELELHIDDLLTRFQNKALKDTIFRVGQDLPRKLNIDDRFAGIIQLAKQKNLEHKLIIEAMVYGFFFRKTNERGEIPQSDQGFNMELKTGVENVLTKLCGFDQLKDKTFIMELLVQYKTLAEHRL